LNDASIVLPGTTIADGSNIIIDTGVPTVVSITSSTSDGTYGVGAAINVTVTFSEAVTLTAAAVDITLDTTDVVTISGTQGPALSFSTTYTVGAGDTSGDLDATAIGLSGGTIRDSALNDASIVLPGTTIADGSNIIIDTGAPTVSSITSSTPNGAYNAGDPIDVTVTFSKVVTVTGNPRVQLETGAVDRYATYGGGSGTSALTFTYTVQGGDGSGDLDYVGTGSLELNGGTIRDAGLNDAVLTLPAPGAAGSLGANKAIVVDTSAPTISSITSATGNGTYGIGANIDVTVTFSESVTLDAAAALTITLDTADVVTIGGPAGPGTMFSGTYTVGAGDFSLDLDATGIALSAGALTDAAGNNASVSLPGTTIADGSAIVVKFDQTSPGIVGGTVDALDTYIDVQFSEGVYSTAGGSGALVISDFSVVFAQNGGTATGVSVTSVTKNNDTPLVGGETVVRLHITVTGLASGVETVAIGPADGSSVFDQYGNASLVTESTGPVALNAIATPLAPGKVIIRNNIVDPKAGTHTTLNFRLSKAQKVTITVYDLAGRPVKVLYDRTGNIGLNEVIWDGKNREGRTVVHGVYYVVVLIDKERYVHKVLVAR
jgi:hypothetical protein